jgi:thiosulfate/3-mercaptopyruvate sulfurtransferase
LLHEELDMANDVGQAVQVPHLVDVDWVRQHLAHPDVRFVEAGADAGSYYEGHVAGAVVLSWLDDLHDPDRRGVLSQDRLERLLGSLGINETNHVVLYGDDDNTFAAYAYWVLRYYGHRRLSLLDGGRRAWLAAAAPVTTDLPSVTPGKYVSTGPDETVRATRDLVLDRFVGAPAGTALLDCRTDAEYHGRGGMVVDLPVLLHRLGGHIPGARNLSSAELLDPDSSRFLPLAELRRVVTAQGVQPQDDVVLYCEVGQRSALGWFVVHEVLHQARARNYDGGWAEYGSLVGAPVSR